MKKIKEFINMASGKGENSRTYAIVMLAIYAVVIGGLVILIRTSPKTEKKEPSNNTDPTPVVEPTPNNNTNTNKKKKTNIESDVNYSYSYVVKYDNETETYLGKRVDDKEKFTYTKGDSTIEYAIKDDNYLILKDNTYHITDTLNTYFRYCDVSSILNLLETDDGSIDGNKITVNASNKILAEIYEESLKNDNKQINKVEIIIDVEKETVTNIKMDLSNYISSLLDSNHTLNITMEFANIGTTEDFDIKIN